jgi:hypothetical protein
MRDFHRYNKGGPSVDQAPECQSRGICILVPVVFTLAVVMGAYSNTLLLPRYLVPAIPFALIVVLFLLERVSLQRVSVFVLAGGIVLFVANYNGRYYPANFDSFSVVERSHAYQSFNSVKVSAIAALANKPTGVNAYVTKEINYMISDPMMGYADAGVPGTYPVFNEPYRSRPLSDYPDHFFLLRASVIHGGRKIGELVNAANKSDGYHVSEQVFQKDGFIAQLYEIERQ